MTIEEISPRERTGVLWVGQAVPPYTTALLKQLGFSVDELSSLPLSDGVLGGLAGVVFVQDDAKPLTIVSKLEVHVARLLDHGCLVFVLATHNGLVGVEKVLKQLKIPSIWPTTPPADEGIEVFDGCDVHPLSDIGIPPMPHVRVYRAATSPEHDVVNLLVRYGPQHPPAAEVTEDVPGRFKITGPAAQDVKTEQRLMLRRSFYDCGELHLDYVSDTGQSAGVTVYIAHAALNPPRGARQLLHARRLLPFFVKIGPRRKIIPEWRNYEERVRQQVPFHLAPHLVAERCELGAHMGIIVGDFVEDSESLGDCSRSGRAMTPIGTLFDRTLRGWHRQANTQNKGLLYVMLRKLLEGDVSTARVDTAKNLYKIKRTPTEIKTHLQQRPAEDLLCGPIHNDLHADNIRVRGNDAILIDFFSTRDGLLLADPAALEVSLGVRVPTNNEDFNREAWLRTMFSLFSQDALRRPPVVHDSTEPYVWIASCIRQVRLHALPMQRKPDQYAHVLAYYFLRAAITDTDFNLKKDPHGHEGFRRAAAYVFADSLLDMKWV